VSKLIKNRENKGGFMKKLLMITTLLFITALFCKQAQDKNGIGKNNIRVSEKDRYNTEKKAIDSLCNLLTNPDSVVRKEAISHLFYYQDHNSFVDVPTFTFLKNNMMIDLSITMQCELLGLIMYFPDSFYQEADRQLLLEIAADSNKYRLLRVRSFIILSRIHDDRAVALAMSTIKTAQNDYSLFNLDQENKSILGSSISYLCELKYLPAIPEIKKTINTLINNRSQIKYPLKSTLFPAYLMHFEKFGPNNIIIEYLDSLLISDSDTVRYYAAIGLAFLKQKYIFPTLVKLLNDPKITKMGLYKGNIVASIEQLQNKETIPVLKGLLSDTTGLANIAADALRRSFGYKIDNKTQEITYEPPEYKDLK
jgi:hypothetical protein